VQEQDKYCTPNNPINDNTYIATEQSRSKLFKLTNQPFGSQAHNTGAQALQYRLLRAACFAVLALWCGFAFQMVGEFLPVNDV